MQLALNNTTHHRPWLNISEKVILILTHNFFFVWFGLPRTYVTVYNNSTPYFKQKNYNLYYMRHKTRHGTYIYFNNSNIYYGKPFLYYKHYTILYLCTTLTIPLFILLDIYGYTYHMLPYLM